MIAPRPLRVLLIHDNLELGDDPSTVLRSTRYEMVAPSVGVKRPYVASWFEVVQSVRAVLSGHEQASMGANGKTALPDLLIIDCNFEEDKQAPALTNGFGGASHHVDPRGLLYGALWAAYMSGKASHHPFAFILYSQAADQIQEDGLGLTLFGLLLAMSEPDAEYTAAENSQGAEVQRLREALPKYVQRWDISEVIERVAELYRQRLLRMSLDDLVSVDPTRVEDCLDAVKAFVAGKGRAPSDELGISWRVHNQEDHVQLASLAPDAMGADATWDPRRCGLLVQWLAALRDGTNWKTQKWKKLIEARDRYDGDKRTEIFKALSKGPSERDGFRVLAMIMVWCERQCCLAAAVIPAVTAQDILTTLGMETHQAQRPLRRFFDPRITLGPFLDSLFEQDTWPYESLSWVVPATRSYLRDLASPTGITKPWVQVGPEKLSLPKSVFAPKNWPSIVA